MEFPYHKIEPLGRRPITYQTRTGRSRDLSRRRLGEGGSEARSTNHFSPRTSEKLVPTGTMTITVVPRPGAVWISNLPPISDALCRMLVNPRPSLFSNRTLEMPQPLSFIRRVRVGACHSSVTAIRVGLACRAALWIASWPIRNSSCFTLGGKLSSGI